METIKRTKVKDLLRMEPGADVLAKAWVRTKRGNKGIAFIALNDGSCINNIQVVVDKTAFPEDLLQKVTTGACIAVEGKLVESLGSGQAVEIQASGIEVLGECDPMRYPLQKKDTSFEYLRSVAHMRMRTNTFGAIMRIRNHMANAIHRFFYEKGFVYLNTPLITASDCEGAGEMFQVRGSLSTSTGVAPRYLMGLQLAQKVKLWQITSSPGPTPSEISAKCTAAVPADSATTCLPSPTNCSRSASKPLTFGPNGTTQLSANASSIYFISLPLM